MKTEIFHIADIISAATGIMVRDGGFDGFFRLLTFMCQEDISLHQTKRVSEEAEASFYEQFPWLHEIDTSTINEDNWQSWLNDVVESYGEYHEVRPMNQQDHERLHPQEELRRILSDNTDDKAIIIQSD